MEESEHILAAPEQAMEHSSRRTTKSLCFSTCLFLVVSIAVFCVGGVALAVTMSTGSVNSKDSNSTPFPPSPTSEPTFATTSQPSSDPPHPGTTKAPHSMNSKAPHAQHTKAPHAPHTQHTKAPHSPHSKAPHPDPRTITPTSRLPTTSPRTLVTSRPSSAPVVSPPSTPSPEATDSPTFQATFSISDRRDYQQLDLSRWSEDEVSWTITPYTPSVVFNFEVVANIEQELASFEEHMRLSIQNATTNYSEPFRNSWALPHDFPSTSIRVKLHVVISIRVLFLCLGSSCHPTFCPLHILYENAGIVLTNVAASNNERLFGSSKDCSIVKPEGWDEWVKKYAPDVVANRSESTRDYFMDWDFDGLSNIIEFYGVKLVSIFANVEGNFSSLNGTNPLVADTDGDNFTDAFEWRFRLDPHSVNANQVDSDGDTRSDILEGTLPFWTDPFRGDTDGDGISDRFDFRLTALTGARLLRAQNRSPEPSKEPSTVSKVRTKKEAISKTSGRRLQGHPTSFPTMGVDCFGRSCENCIATKGCTHLLNPDIRFRPGTCVPNQIAPVFFGTVLENPDGCPCTQCSKWAESEDREFIEALPQCPCSVHLGQGDDFTIDPIRPLPAASEGDWGIDLGCRDPSAVVFTNCEFHPGATRCMRADVGGTAQQCCYTRNGADGAFGDIMPTGVLGAGTPDRASSSESIFDHYFEDVVTAIRCCSHCQLPEICDKYKGSEDGSVKGARADHRGCV